MQPGPLPINIKLLYIKSAIHNYLKHNTLYVSLISLLGHTQEELQC